MSITYTPTTNFGSKDVLPANDPNKVIVGAEFTSEFNAIQAAFALAAPTSNPTFSGTATYNNLNVTGTFTSRGIDDNATSTAITIDSNENVGIGETPASNHRLVVKYDANETPLRVESIQAGSYIRMTGTGGTAYVGQKDGGLSFQSAAAERMVISSSGNVGIGDTAPAEKLTVDGNVRINKQPDATGGITWDLSSTNFGSIKLNGNEDMLFNLRAAGSSSFVWSRDASEFMRIDSSGNVGIGTTNPASKLHVQGEVGTTNGTAAAPTHTFYSDNDTGMFRAAVNTLGFSAAGTEHMRIDASGNLLVGTTVGTGPRLRAERGGIVAEFNRSSGTSSLISFQYGGVDAGYITSSAGGTPSFVAASDERLKDNIVDHESELANVMSLRPTRWDWKDEAKGSGEGFIAQELQETAWADLVSEGDDGMLQVSGLGSVETRLIKAIQEQQALIEALTAKVEALENA